MGEVKIEVAEYYQLHTMKLEDLMATLFLFMITLEM
jgi:hypothetical protein